MRAALLLHGLTPEYCGKRPPRAMRAMRGKTLETVPFQPWFGCTKSFLKVLSKLVLPSNESYESKAGCNRTLPTVLWVPLRYIMVFVLFEWRGKHPRTIHPNKNSLRNCFQHCLYKRCPLFLPRSRRKRQKELGQSVCANCFHLGGWLFGWVPSFDFQSSGA